MVLRNLAKPNIFLNFVLQPPCKANSSREYLDVGEDVDAPVVPLKQRELNALASVAHVDEIYTNGYDAKALLGSSSL